MALALLFSPKGMTVKKYGDVMKRLEQAGASAPKGRSYHVCFGKGSKLQVFDVWDSKESFEKFGQTLVPILKELGVNPGKPKVVEVVNTVRG